MLKEGTMNDFTGFGLSEVNDQGRRRPNRDEPRLRAVGSPLPVGLRDPSPLQPVQDDAQRYRSAPPPPERALARSAPAAQPRTGLQRAAGALRAALPFVQRILPLLDGNIGTAVSNVLAPYPQMPPPAPPVDLEPIEDSLSELQMQHRALRNQFLEQKTALKRVEDQLETVREATDRTAREQEEVLEGMVAVRKKVNRFAILASALLAVSLLLNMLLFLHFQHILP
jgi:hypothetical protein